MSGGTTSEPPAEIIPGVGRVEAGEVDAPFARVWIIGFAGHRHLADPAAVKAALRIALQEFHEGMEGIVTGRSGAAAGADLLFLEACREMGIAYSVVLPFPVERFAEDFDDPAEWARAEAAIAAARNVEIAPGSEGPPAAYHLAAREILDVCDVMLCCWDDQPARGIGGTAESVSEARERKLPLRIISAQDASLGALESGAPLPWGDESFASLPPLPTVEMVFGELDRRAMQGAPRSRYFAALSISLNQLATLIYAVLVAFGLGVDAAPAVKFLIVTVAALLPWIGSRTRIHEAWVEDRIRAELLRSLLASHAFAPPLRPFAADLFPADRALLCSAAWQLAPRRRSWEEEKKHYLAERLDGQISYLATKGDYAAGRLKRLERVFRTASFGAMVLGAVAIMKGLQSWELPWWLDHIVLMFLPIVLPAIAAWCLAMIPLFEHKRRAGLYRQMVDRLRQKRCELAESKCFTTAAAVVSSCERLLLTELWEWSGSRGKRR